MRIQEIWSQKYIGFTYFLSYFQHCCYTLYTVNTEIFRGSVQCKETNEYDRNAAKDPPNPIFHNSAVQRGEVEKGRSLTEQTV